MERELFWRKGRRLLPDVDAPLSPAAARAVLVIASLESLRCPLCGGGKPEKRTFCDPCCESIPWRLRRRLCGPVEEYVLAFDAVFSELGASAVWPENGEKK